MIGTTGRAGVGSHGQQESNPHLPDLESSALAD